MNNTADRKQIAYTVAAAASETLADLKGVSPLQIREYLECNLTVKARRFPAWSARQMAWVLANKAATEVKTHFVLDSDGISESQIFTGILDKLEASA